MPKLFSTETLTRDMIYFCSASDFFSNFPAAWKNVSTRVYKLETKMSYQETDNPSYDAYIRGDLDKAIELIKKSKEKDYPVYESLRKRGVNVYRCRPVLLPLSDYLNWEFECYKENSKQGELIFLSEGLDIYKTHALHDFMLFDDKVALVHNYDENGLIQGGWMTTDSNKIASFKTLLNIL
ncbi:DUF6879 family protein [Thaumasiovibrio subtropicus]|uniref:DUF6879 family protein n=2 Tax=Thaumasiovibrio subtropicus TaxID=1891207 RepID=UPI001C866937|nr:DUF6879 family protein [Thaumasiovibrio subtropicus]